MIQIHRALPLLLILAVALASVGCPRPPSRGSRLPALTEDNREAVFLDEPLTFCRTDRNEAREAKVQVVLDASGSMAGFTKTVPALVTWFQHALSLLRESSINVTEGRVCEFSIGLGGIGNCQSLNAPVGNYVPKSDTNLHVAIRSAANYDLTLLLTDGVAATGSGGEGDCASGVDAACVARSLREVLSQESLDSSDGDWGVWLIPMIARYSGPFFTEQRLDPGSLDRETTVGNVVDDFGGDPKALNPRRLQNGTLAFDYAGPRAMVLIVLARGADLGRSTVETLWDRAGHLGVQRLERSRDFSGRDAILPPIELYPGFANRVEWQQLEPSTQARSRVGTLDAVLEAGEVPSLKVNCPPGGAGEGYFRLEGTVPRSTKVAGCVEIYQLPAIRFELASRNAGQQSELSRFIRSYRRAEGGQAVRLDLHLGCDRQTLRSCQEPLTVDWRAQRGYAQASDCLASGCNAAVAQRIRALSTQNPSEQPHRIFGFAETLEEFLRLSSGDSLSQLVGAFEICRGGGGGNP